jgi:integrase
MSNKINFTKASIDTLPCPEKGKRAYYYDTNEKGLILDVKPSGSKSFYLYRKIDGKPERVFLGIYPDMKIPEARAAAAIKKGMIAKGINPQDEKRKIRQEITFGDLFTMYMERYSKIHKKSWVYDEREINKFLSHWFKRKISSIKKHEVQRLHEDLRQKNGLYQANRILERIRALYNKGAEWGYEGGNPAQGIKKHKEKARDRFILPAELPFLFSALDEEHNKTAKDFILISLMTGARKTNVLQMRWEQIDWHNHVWRIPDTKNGEPISIPLIKQAIEILEKRLSNAKASKKQLEWVFDGDGKNGHLADPKKSWERVRQNATLSFWKQNPEWEDLIRKVEEKIKKLDNYGYTSARLIKEILKEAERLQINLPSGLLDLRIHDIRRTLGSYQAITGTSLPIIGKTLGHKSQQSTTIYARLNLDPVRASMEKATDAIFHSMGDKR